MRTRKFNQEKRLVQDSQSSLQRLERRSRFGCARAYPRSSTRGLTSLGAGEESATDGFIQTRTHFQLWRLQRKGRGETHRRDNDFAKRSFENSAWIMWRNMFGPWWTGRTRLEGLVGAQTRTRPPPPPPPPAVFVLTHHRRPPWETARTHTVHSLLSTRDRGGEMDQAAGRPPRVQGRRKSAVGAHHPPVSEGGLNDVIAPRDIASVGRGEPRVRGIDYGVGKA
jgi:hypothetical protein